MGLSAIFGACFKAEGQAAVPACKSKVVATKQSSYNWVSVSDLSNPVSTTLSEDLSVSLAGSNLYVFTLAEMKLITQGFSSGNFLGEGGFGPVHKGFIDDKLRLGLKAQTVAVKLLNLDGSQGHKEWLVRSFPFFNLFFFFFNFFATSQNILQSLCALQLMKMRARRKLYFYSLKLIECIGYKKLQVIKCSVVPRV